MAEAPASMSQPSFWESVVDACPNFVGVAVATAGQTISDVSKGLLQVVTGHGAEVADGIDARAAESMKWINSLGSDLVDRFPNKFGVAAATVGTTLGGATLQFGQGMADIARLGTGVAKGTVGGYLEDGLRLLPLLTPAVRSLQELRLARLAKVYPDPLWNTGACLPISIVKALRQTGQTKAFAKLSDMVSGLASDVRGVDSLVEGRRMEEMTRDLRRLGAKFLHVQTSESLEGVEALTRARPNGVTVFGARWEPLNQTTGKLEKPVGHAMYAFIDKLGRFRIADRSNLVVSSLKELEPMVPTYKGISNASIPNVAMFIPQARYLSGITQAGGLALELNVVATRARTRVTTPAPAFRSSHRH